VGCLRSIEAGFSFVWFETILRPERYRSVCRIFVKALCGLSFCYGYAAHHHFVPFSTLPWVLSWVYGPRVVMASGALGRMLWWVFCDYLFLLFLRVLFLPVFNRLCVVLLSCLEGSRASPHEKKWSWPIGREPAQAAPMSEGR